MRRAVEGITAAVIVVFTVSGFLGLRAVVWRQDYAVAAMIQTGIITSALIGAVLAVAYVLLGSWVWRLLRVDWLSLQFGAVVGALLYGGYNAITPLTVASIGETPLWRALQGGIDGLVIGVVVGAVVMVVSGRPLRFDRFSLTRYLIVFVAVVLVAWLILLVEGFLRVSDTAAVALALPALLILKLIVARLDRRGGAHIRYDEYEYEDGGD